MKLGIYGGTFAPVHNGHINAARAFRDGIGLDRELVIPAYMPPHKEKKDTETPGDRLEMLRAAFSEDEKIEVSDYEIIQGGKSYTYLTLEHFAEGNDLYMLVGTDMFLTLGSWKNPDIIFSLATVVMIKRYGGNDAEIIDAKEKYEKNFGARIIFLDADVVEVSSTDVRERLENGLDVSSLIPDPVISYIRAKGLYFGNSYLLSLCDGIRNRLHEFVDAKRTGHVLAVEEKIVWLGKLLNCGERNIIYLRAAGLLHDITKNKSPEWQTEYLTGIGVPVDGGYLECEKTLHELSGAYYAREKFPDLVNDAVFSAILHHTTGSLSSDLFENLLFLADYIEDTRSWDDCVTVRNYFEGLLTEMPPEQVVLRATRLAVDLSIMDLIERNGIIHENTVKSRNNIIKEIKLRYGY